MLTAMDKINYQYHELCTLMPELLPEDYAKLRADIRRNGLINPIQLYEGKVLDGRHRYRACIELTESGVDPAHINMRFDSTPPAIDPYAFVISQNLHRRHLPKGQLTALFESQVHNLDPDDPEYQRIAEVWGVKVRKWVSAKKPEKDSLADDSVVLLDRHTVSAVRKVNDSDKEELKEAMLTGKITPHDAVKLVNDSLGDAQVESAIKRIRSGVKPAKAIAEVEAELRVAKDAEAVKQLPAYNDRYAVYCADLRNLSEFVDRDSVDLIVTDPPYPAEYLDCFAWVMDAANHALKPGGMLVVMSGQANFPLVMERMQNHKGLLQWYWLATYHHPQRAYSPPPGRNVRSLYKPLLVYYKPNGVLPHLADTGMVASDDTGITKELHKWQQSLAGFRNILRNCGLRPGMTVLDPFCGSGTTLLAAMQETAGNCRVIGMDIDQEAVNTALVQLAEASPFDNNLEV